MPLCPVRLESDDVAPARDPYRSLAAAIEFKAHRAE